MIDEKAVAAVARAIHRAGYEVGRQIAPGFPGDYLKPGERFSDNWLAHERLTAQARAAILAYESAKPREAEVVDWYDFIPASVVDKIATEIANLPWARAMTVESQCDRHGEVQDIVAKHADRLRFGSRLTVEGVEAVVVPVEPDELITDAIKKALRNTRSGGVCGMTIDAQWRSECAREIAAYRAMLSAAGDGHDR